MTASTPDIRVATYNAALNRDSAGALHDDLISGDAQARDIAAVIQQSRPDVLLINEFDYDPAAAELFREHYLGTSQGDAPGIDYPYIFSAPVNTGVTSGVDLDGSGEAVTTPGAPGYADDALGFGQFPGQYGMLVLSRYPLESDDIRTFGDFLWKDMPGARLPDNPETADTGDYYSDAALDVLPLSSKSHWDIPVNVDGEILHLLASHPTPPSFDGPENRNGLRNADEIRLWADYVTPGKGDYLVDDQGRSGGLEASARFVIAGDQNVDPLDGDSLPGAAQQLLGHPLIAAGLTPDSEGGVVAALEQGGANTTHRGDPRFDTADFNDEAPGNLRVDYVLPSDQGLTRLDGGVFWPVEDDTGSERVEASDHRLVWADLAIDDNDTQVQDIEFIGQTAFDSGTEFQNTTLGGLSGLTRDPVSGEYLAISDDRSEYNDARFYSLRIDLDDGALNDGDVRLTDVTTLRQPGGAPWAAGEIDPEAIAITADGTLYIASEGDSNQRIDPFVNLFARDGEQIDAIELPKILSPDGDGSWGVRNNLALESVTLTPDGEHLFTATENALAQDGPAAALDTGSPSRILSFDPDTGEALGQYLYPVEPTPQAPVEGDGFSTNGLVEMLALDEHHLLTLERGFAEGAGNDIRLYEIDLSRATNISHLDSLEDATGTVRPVQKTLLTSLNDYGFEPDNVEGMTFGPALADGRQSLILTSDDNFSDTQSTQFIALAFDEAGADEPAPPAFDEAFSLLPAALHPATIMASLMGDIAALPGGAQAMGMLGDQASAVLSGIADSSDWPMPA
ncbi:esterase-like activity of phytase family protein [Kushneria sp. TE3]|uniref:esterase-like activity of phytase family protein n=1 Tax=Kushneria sp. TE3 TaxID=3449832 RepID=UPI003F68490B